MTDSNCLFCRIISGEIPAKKVYEDNHVLAFEDIDPKAPTHVLIIPKKHFAGLKEAETEDAELIGRCHLAAAQIARDRKIEQGYRTVLNVGPGAGQSVFHLHLHLLPRWIGDSNFMTVTGETRVNPEDLKTTYERLSKALKT